MADLKAGQTLVVASHNPGKVWEIKQLIAPYGLDAVSAGDLNLPEPEETETTFHGNAALKATAAARASGHAALADDSGLEVADLDGEPGIYSARWAGPEKDFHAAMQKVAREVEQRRDSNAEAFDWSRIKPAANFICVLCLAWPCGETQMFEGRVDGHLVWPPRGGNGFGYDPMFVADGMQQTFGEIEPEAKHALSHRRRAFDLFEEQCLAGLEKVSPTADGSEIEGLNAAAANLSTQAEFAIFVQNVRRVIADDAKTKKETRTVDQFLAAIESWAQSATVSEAEPKWRTMAKALLAAALKE